tara:strand:- start:60 stop:515 length:456 start_codon:yes stop_codon:yes gene_type:complete
VDKLSYKTISINKASSDKQWFLVDAKDQILGRLSSKVAKILRGKYKTNYTPHADCGDNVVIINSEKITMSGNKMDKREIFSHTGFPGGQKRITPNDMLKKDGTSLIKHAVKGMLPKNKLGSAILKNLYLYEGEIHQQEAQNPKKINLNDLI